MYHSIIDQNQCTYDVVNISLLFDFIEDIFNEIIPNINKHFYLRWYLAYIFPVYVNISNPTHT